jgi:DNA-binding MarR family transcriptional regulator
VDIEPSQFTALAEFRHQIRKFLHFSEQAARAASLEPQQHQLLLALKGCSEEEITVGYLAERLQIRHHSAVELIDRMVGHELVRRAPSLDDRRRVLVELTKSGDMVLRKLSAEHVKELQQTGPALVDALESLLPALKAVR